MSTSKQKCDCTSLCGDDPRLRNEVVDPCDEMRGLLAQRELIRRSREIIADLPKDTIDRLTAGTPTYDDYGIAATALVAAKQLSVACLAHHATSTSMAAESRPNKMGPWLRWITEVSVAIETETGEIFGFLDGEPVVCIPDTDEDDESYWGYYHVGEDGSWYFFQYDHSIYQYSAGQWSRIAGRHEIDDILSDMDKSLEIGSGAPNMPIYQAGS